MVLLAKTWNPEKQDLTGWWISEKLDGVRAYWTGSKLVSRGDNEFAAPEWFIRDLPDHPLDGELWCGRKEFQKTISAVRKNVPRDHEWEQVLYVIFDAPEMTTQFEHRSAYLNSLKFPFAKVHHQESCLSSNHLYQMLAHVESLGGEGLMARKPGSFYENKRSSTLLKIKNFLDAEATVVGHSPGQGKHAGRLGALKCVLEDGTKFNVGTGFSDDERDDPPEVGSVITFRYQELTKTGTPRFPAYVRERIDYPSMKN